MPDLLIKYPDNDIKFFDLDGSTEVMQAFAFSMVVYDNDGTTPLKTIEFYDDNGDSSILLSTTRYEKV